MVKMVQIPHDADALTTYNCAIENPFVVEAVDVEAESIWFD